VKAGATAPGVAIASTLATIAIVAIAGACGGGVTTIDEYPCPSNGTPLSYETFGRDWLNANCQTCHGQPSKDRHGAPPDVDFRTREDVARYRERIFARAAANNRSMPPGPYDPPEKERYQLAEWLACGAP
jgi:uncharacterized membrane protein